VTYLQALLLGLVQGLTEFLPVSSDGHLVLAEHLARVRTPGVFVEVMLHVATLGSILIVYGRRFGMLVTGFLRRDPEHVRYAGLMLIAMVPAGLVGVLLRDVVARTFDSLWVAGFGFWVTGAALWYTGRGPAGSRERPTVPQALLIGVAQALAILPGVSRSGMTVASGIRSGMGAVRAAEFSFLMAIPVIAGAGVLEARHMTADVGLVGVGPLLVACLVAFLSGVWAIRLLVAVLARGQFHRFAPYCFVIGAFTLGIAAWRG
jgi:undecaprenyl-diphosphatase